MTDDVVPEVALPDASLPDVGLADASLADASLPDGLRRCPDGLLRCWWPGDDPLATGYHDDEWGRPVRDEGRMFEMLVLESFQAGLSWITILRRRDGFRAAFDGFDAAAVAGYGDADVARLLADTRIIRNRAKILATIGNAQATLRLHDEGLSLVTLLRAAAPSGERMPPRTRADVPATSPEAVALAKDLKRRGFRFLGPTVLYAHLQATGVVDDHLVGCAFRGASASSSPGADR